MFYQEALPKFRFYPMSIACLQLEIDTGKKIAATFEKAESGNSLPFAVYFQYWCLFLYGCL